MSLRSLASRSIAAAVGASMLALSLSPASLQQPVVSAQIDKVWWRHRGWGWGPGAIIGGLAAGALVGGYYGGYYGPGYYGYGPGYYDPCWRRVGGPWGGWHWARVC